MRSADGPQTIPAEASSGGTQARPVARDAVLGALDELTSLTENLLAASVRRDLIDARARVAEGRFNLAVLGEFKRGKSTLVNALLEQDLLPTGVVPLTSVVTVIAAGPRARLTVRHLDGRTVEHPLDELSQYVTEARNPGNRLGVDIARVELGHELLDAGLELVDTPGVGSVHGHNTETAHDFLPRVDAGLCVLDAGQPITAGERGLLVEAMRRIPRVIVVLNKIDHLDEADRDTAIGFVREVLDELLGSSQIELYAVNARGGEGVAPLRRRLIALARRERQSLLVRSVGGVGHDAAAAGVQAARFEARAIQLPLDELDSRARAFDRRIVELRAASQEAGDLLQQATQRALTEVVNTPLQGHARAREGELRSAVSARADELRDLSSGELARALQRWIDESISRSFEELAPRYETALADELSRLELRYASRVGEILEQVQAAARDTFGARPGDVLPRTGLRTPSRFSFKLRDAESGLDMIVGFGRAIAPGALGRRLVVRDAQQRLVQMTDRHAGRLRSELVERASNSVADYRRELTGVVDEAIVAIQAAVERASDDRRRGEARAQARLAELSRIAVECERIAGLMAAAFTRDH